MESTPCDGGLPTCIVEPYMQLGRFPHQANQFADSCFAQRCEAVLMQAVMEPAHGLMRRAGIEIGAEDVADPGADNKVIIPFVPGKHRPWQRF